MSSASQKVSFTVRRPTPPSRTESSGGDSDNVGFKLPALPRRLVGAHDSKPGSPLAAASPDRTPISYYSPDPDSSDDEDGPAQDELLTSFDQITVQRSSKKRKSDNGPLVIPVLKNKDWREVARKRRGAAQFVPASAQALTTKDGSGTRDLISTGPVLAGLQIKKKEAIVNIDAEDVGKEEQDVKMEAEETEDERALHAVLASAKGTETESTAIRIIPTPVTESDALRQDVAELPDVATLDDYERVPVSQFGAALLRGMGWKEGTAASRNGKGLADPYLPQARPALLGIGAKEKEIFDDGSGKKRPGRPERKYVPVVRKERDDESVSSDTPRSSNRSSRRSSRSPDRRKERGYEDTPRAGGDRRYNGDRERDNDRYRVKERDRGSGCDTDRRRNGDRSEKDRRRNRSRESRRR